MRTLVGSQHREQLAMAQGDTAMKHQILALARILVAAAALVALALLVAGVSSAEDLASTSFRLRGGTLSGGGEVALQGPGPLIGSGGVTIGQPGPVPSPARSA